MTRRLAALRALWIPPAEVRAEAWAISARHGGRVVEGAREEGQAPGLTVRRAVLLKAVIRQHGRALQAAGRKGQP